jgi:hypothetical protein
MPAVMLLGSKRQRGEIGLAAGGGQEGGGDQTESKHLNAIIDA